MTLRIPDVGEEQRLKLILGKTAAESLLLKLFVSNTAHAEANVAGTYTEMSTQGYAAKTLVPGDWTVTPGDPCLASCAQQTWTFDGTGGDTIVYGYMLVGATSGVLYWAELFAAPYTVRNNGDQIKLTPKLTDKDEGD